MDTQYVLWIDGVGGYLICLSHRVTLGQAGANPSPDIAILADVSRHHATIQRDAEGYFLEAVRSVALNGQDAAKAFLHSGDRVTLGSACQFLFTQPVPISTSARLEPVSGHRLLQPVSAVLLMAETLVFGPGSQTHVLIEDLPQPLILFRQKAGLALRYGGKLTVNGEVQKDRSPLAPGDRITTDALTLALERV